MLVFITSRGVSTKWTDEQQRVPAAKKCRMILLVNFFSLSIGGPPLDPKSIHCVLVSFI
jgi:hypothetical protein